MLSTILLLVGIGTAWTLVGVSQSVLASRKATICAFYALATLFAVPGAWIFCYRPAGWATTVSRLDDLVLVLLGACLLNCAGQACLVYGMQCGHRAVTLAIAQSAMVLTFCASILFWGERPGVIGLGGLLVVLCGICILSATRHAPAATFDRRWFFCATASFLLIGAGQILTIWPSYWVGWNDDAQLRTPLTLSISCAIYLSAMLFLRDRPIQSHLLPAVLWAIGAVSAFLMLFRVLDQLAVAGSAGCAFPVGIGLSLLGFALYSHLRLREPFSRQTVLGLGCVLAGIAAIVVHVIEKGH